MSKASEKRAVKRAIEMLRIVKKYMDENPVTDFYIHYDGAECDGSCVADDCVFAADELAMQFGFPVPEEEED